MLLRRFDRVTRFRRWARPSLFIWVIAILLTTLVAPSHWTTGQEINDVFITLDGILNISWSADGQRVAFFKIEEDLSSALPGVVTTLPVWGLLDMNTGEVTWSTVWPFQPDLSETELETFNPTNYIYVSPNEQLLAFSRKLTGDRRPLYTLANRQQGTILPTVRYAPPRSVEPDLVQAFWSNDSSALAISSINHQGRVYVDYFDIPDGNDLSTVAVYEFNPAIDDVEYITIFTPQDRLYDISADGERVLLTGRSFNPPEYYLDEPGALIVWTPRNLENSQIFRAFDVVHIRAAAFAPHDETKAVLIIEDRGLVLYDLVTGQTVDVPLDISDEINIRELQGTLDVIPAQFSPNGEWFSIYTSGGLLLIDIASRVSQITFDSVD